MSTSGELTSSECADAIDSLAERIESGDRSLDMQGLIGRIAVCLTATAARNVRGVALLNRLGVLLIPADVRPRYAVVEASVGRMAPLDVPVDMAALRSLARDLRDP
jgi:hypothetical protein